MKKNIWFRAFDNSMNTTFTKKDFQNYKKMVLKDLKYYKKYLKSNARILDLGCGLGCTVVPLSTLGYKVVGIDNNSRVVRVAKQNAKTFGKDIKIIKSDIFRVSKIFKANSFDACISGGLLEHFKRNKIRKIIKMQLEIAPLVIASMPVKTKRTMKHYGFTNKTALNHISFDGIYRNFWSEKEWIDDVLNGFNVVKHFVKKANPIIGNFDEIFIIIKR